MKDFFKGVRKHLDRLDAPKLRVQYEALSRENEFLEAMLGALDRGIVSLDSRGEIRFANACVRKLLGDDWQQVIAELEISNGRASKREFSLTYPSAIDIELTTHPMPDGQTLAVFKDVTELRQRNREELQDGTAKALRELASGVAHEIGNPLNAISLNLQLLERNPSDHESLRACREQINRLDGIIKGFLAALRPQQPVLKPGSPVPAVKNCLSALRPQFEQKRITVTLDIDAALPVVAIDNDQFEQVCFNLLKNSLEALSTHGEIAITIHGDDESIIITIRDNGVGMDAETLERLFEPYRTTKEHGNGLGTMISQRIVRAHGGTIAVESAPGKGTSFIIRLPRLERRIRELQ